MKPIERMVKTLNGEKTDRIPVYPLVSGVTRHLVGANYYDWANNPDICSEALIAAQELLQTDCICTLTDLSVEASDFGQVIIYPQNEAAHPDHNNPFIASIEDYQRLKPIDLANAPRMQAHIACCEKLVAKKGQEVPIVAFVFGPLGILSMLRGQSNLYMDLYDCKEKVLEAVELINESLITYCQALIKTGVHAIMLDTLFASQSIMSKAMWMEFEGQFVRKLAQTIHDANCMVMIHNCGNGIYFDVQIETMKPEAISFLHVADDCKDFAEMKAKYGDKTTLIGAIDPTWLPQAKPEEVIAECIKHIKLFSPRGKFVLATGCEYPANLSLDYAKLICQTAFTYQKNENKT